MSEDLAKKLARHREEKSLDAFAHRLKGIRVEQFLTHEEVPREALSQLDTFSKLSTRPNTTIASSASPEIIERWYSELLHDAQLESRFYCSTGFEYFAWMQCDVSGAQSISSLRGSIGNNLDFIAHRGRSVASVLEDEYDYLGFFSDY
ncbi:hypothetical protein IRT45_27620 [Nocardia sp. BSTN01]|uniref:hypothetical protein n=1 Tax=Nocardia sp. BSTN01 TaxID=2783665 RepID=UPI0018906CF7|nr:hypothetical protein [Nocardia sp. BSTN01]MBF5000913.1 hypothetical protein [Nocardia sp. BSTN01]